MENESNDMEYDEDDKDISSDDDSSSDSSSEEETMDDGFIDRLEVKLNANPYDFSAHRDYVQALRRTGDLERLRTARNYMSSLFPLPKDLWMAWIEDEERLASSMDEKRHVLDLCRKATSDYSQLIDVWEFRCKYIERMADDPLHNPTQSEEVRKTFEEALENVGMHLRHGHRIWNAYRTWEKSLLLQMLQGKTDDNVSTDMLKQMDRIRSLYSRELALPLNHIEEVWREFLEWEQETKSEKGMKDIENNYQQALKCKQERNELEESIVPSEDKSDYQTIDYAALISWTTYLSFEEKKSEKEPSRLISLYERCLTVYFLVPDLWKNYVNYLDRTFPYVPNVYLKAHARSVRNCPWDGELWCSYIRAMERAKSPAEEVEAVFEKALVGGLTASADFLQVFESYIDYRRRLFSNGQPNEKEGHASAIRSTFQRGITYLTTYFPGSGGEKSLQRHWAILEGRVLGDLTTMHQLCENMVKEQGDAAESWLFYVDLERFSIGGSLSHCHSVFKRACNFVKDSPKTIWSRWLEFEREVGTLENWTTAMERCRKRQSELSERFAHLQAKEEQLAQERSQKRKQTASSRQLSHDKSKKQKTTRERDTYNNNNHNNNNRNVVELEENRPPPPHLRNDADSRTVFVVNLPFSVNGEELKSIFQQFGTVKDVRLVTYRDGSPKGYGYVEFEAESAAQAALSLNLTELKGRTIKVTISSPPPPVSDRHPNRDQPSSLTIYLSNFNPTAECTEENIRTIFGEASQDIKSIRVIKAKDGSLKGFAYIDFEKEESMSKGLTVDGMEWPKGSGNTIRAARSLPPAKAQTGTAPTADRQRPLGSHPPQHRTTPSGATKRPRAVLVPRTLKVTPGNQTADKESSATSQQQQKQQPIASNEEFRKQFLKK